VDLDDPDLDSFVTSSMTFIPLQPGTFDMGCTAPPECSRGSLVGL
jgi:hypothetical protein